jgi:hypothetical protein
MNIRVVLGICSLFQGFELPEILQFKVKWDIGEKRISRFKSPVSNRCLKSFKLVTFHRHLQRGRNL